MQRRALNDYITVIDGFLDEPEYSRLRAAVLELPIRSPGRGEPGFFQRPGDVPPQVSEHVHRFPAPATHPTAFAPLAHRLEGFPIAEDQRIVEFSMRLQVAAPGASLGAHNDGDDALSGGFTFYLNEAWDAHWGGLLVCFEPELEPARRMATPSALTELGLKLSEAVANVAIAPRRNRLVLLRNPIWHLVTQVLPEAGAHRRLACAGYYRSEKRSR